jgi:hypothetical protein
MGQFGRTRLFTHTQALTKELLPKIQAALGGAKLFHARGNISNELEVLGMQALVLSEISIHLHRTVRAQVGGSDRHPPGGLVVSAPCWHSETEVLSVRSNLRDGFACDAPSLHYQGQNCSSCMLSAANRST